jgi:hypothetical protein
LITVCDQVNIITGDKVRSRLIFRFRDGFADGMTSLIVANSLKNLTEIKVSYLAGVSKPRVVELSTKRRISASLGFCSFAGAQWTIQGYEAIHKIRKCMFGVAR